MKTSSVDLYLRFMPTLIPKHRDRIAFLRVCSGKFERNKYFHHVRLDKDVRFSNPYTFLASEKM